VIVMAMDFSFRPSGREPFTETGKIPKRAPVRSLFLDAAETAVSKKITKVFVDPTINYSTTTDGTVFADEAILIGKVRLMGHETIYRKPLESIGDAAGLTEPLNDVFGAVAQELPLFGDPILRKARESLYKAGMLAAFITGNPHVFLMCFKLYLHDKAIDVTKKAIHETLFEKPAW
jgi:hypothetical protein